MKPENEMNKEVSQLLDTLEEHGKNTRRQAQLSDLIDGLDAKEFGTSTSLRGTKQSTLDEQEETSGLLRCARNDAKRRKLYPLWWAMGAAAACLLLWLLVKPTAKQDSEMNEEILVEKTETIDSVQIKEKKEVIFEEPIVEGKLLAEETMPPGLLRCARNDESPKPKKETAQQNLLAENIFTESPEPIASADTVNHESNNIPIVNEAPLAVQSPKRRVIRSLNLVCYECQKELEHEIGIKPNMDNKTLFGQPQDPNMKNGSLAFELKLN